MKQKTITQVQADLQALADQHGEARFEAAKSAYLSGVIVTDDDGNILKGDQLKFEVTFSAKTIEGDSEVQKSGGTLDAASIASIVAAEIRKQAKPDPAKATDASRSITASRIEAVRVKSKVFSTSEEAYNFGAWAAAIAGQGWAKQFCASKGISIEKDMLESNNSAGGFLVRPEFEPTILRLVEKYGVFRQYAKNVPMTTDFKSYPRRRSGLTAYFVGEGNAGTESQPVYDLVSLTARKIMTLTQTSNELNEDSAVSIADELATESAIAFAYTEDNCGFNGDGTSTYGGITGVRSALTNISGTISSIAGLKVGTGNLYSELVLADFNGVAALLPQYAEMGDGPKWYCHKVIWESVMKKLALAAGGASANEIVQGIRTPTFLGYPVVISQVMPSVEANSQVCALFGNLAMAADFGDRTGRTISMSDSALNAFEKDLLTWRVRERFDINVHDVGSTTAAGPIVGLITAAS